MSFIKDFKEKINNENNKFRQKLTKFFKEETDKLFETTDFIALTWTQYTPGFNDGDPCEFTVGEVYGVKSLNKELFNVDNYSEVIKQFLDEIGSFEELSYLEDIKIHDSLINAGISIELIKAVKVINLGYLEEETLLEKEITQLRKIGEVFSCENFLEDIFGDDVTVIVTEKEMITEFYDCGY